jgi:hypothetical protein
VKSSAARDARSLRAVKPTRRLRVALLFFNGVGAGFKAFSGGGVAYVPATATSGPIRVQNACGSIAGDVSYVVN